MINPFISNQDTQFLFRKNYQVLQKPKDACPSPQPTHNTHLQSLQRRNPFTSHSPIIHPLKSTNLNSPERPVSAAKNLQNLSASRYFSGKGGLLQEADGWRRELQRKQRERAQIYGVEGLRYNAYLGTPRETIQNTDYYQPLKRSQAKSPANLLKSSLLNNYAAENYYAGSDQRQPLQKYKEKSRQEHFFDQINEQPQSVDIVDPRRPGRQIGDSSRHSKVKDMFESQFQDRLKQSMHHGSVYRMNQQQPQNRIKNVYNSSRFAESNNFRRTASMQSEVQRMDVITPDSIKVADKIYYRVPL